MFRLLARSFPAIVAALVGGCVSYSATVETSSSPKPGMAYLTGIFVDTSVQSGALVQRQLGVSFENQETKTEHTVAFRKEGRDYQLVEVPPGTYRVSGWFMANSFNEVLVRGKPQGALFTREFKVTADQVHFLGHYTGSGTVTQSGNMIYRNAQLKPERIVPLSTDREAFAARYPTFAKLPMKAAYLPGP
jgi:hypothetical protein